MFNIKFSVTANRNTSVKGIVIGLALASKRPRLNFKLVGMACWSRGMILV